MAPNKTTSIDQLLIVLELYHRIPFGRKVTAGQLHQQLAEVGIHRDIRTVQRNLELVVKFLDVEKDTRDKPYGYSKRLGTRLTLGPREAILLETALSGLKAAFPTAYHPVIEGAFAPFSRRNSPTAKVDIRPCRPLIEESKMALFERLCFALHYQREIKLQLSPHTLPYCWPLGLRCEQEQFYLIYEYQHTRYAIPLNDIEEVSVSTFEFTYPGHAMSDIHLDSLAPFPSLPALSYSSGI